MTFNPKQTQFVRHSRIDQFEYSIDRLALRFEQIGWFVLRTILVVAALAVFGIALGLYFRS